MARSISSRSLVVVAALAIASGAFVLPDRASADEAACTGFEIDYGLSANLRLSDTPMGEGDGTRGIGPGKTVLRFENKNGEPGGAVKMRSYSMTEKFVVKSKTLFWTTTVTVDSATKGTPDEHGVVAEGVLDGRTLRWTTPIHGYRTDGTLTCDGSLCGKFGAPPAGTSPLHIGPNEVSFKPFTLAADGKTFTMPEAFVSKSDMPKQRAHMALSGREMKRTCLHEVASR